MYNDELEPRLLSLANLYLDPNNPRFWAHKDNKDSKEIPESKFTEAKTLEQTQKRIEEFGVEELYHSILRNGFLPLDRIVVRAIKGSEDSFVAVEGNRRLAALKMLHQRISDGLINEDGIDDEYLDALFKSVQEIEVLVYKGARTDDISWLLQGIRHISGIKDWKPAQRARLIAEQYERKDAQSSFTQVGQTFGLTAIAAGRLYRAYKGLQQMRDDNDFGTKASNDYFSLFEEAYRNTKVKGWLDWNDKEYKFQNTNHLKQFYSWISPDEEDEPEKRRRIHDPKHVQKLAILLANNREDLIDQIDRHEEKIEIAANRAAETPTGDWEKKLDQAKDIVSTLPILKLKKTQPEQLKQKLNELHATVEEVLKMIE